MVEESALEDIEKNKYKLADSLVFSRESSKLAQNKSIKWKRTTFRILKLLQKYKSLSYAYSHTFISALYVGVMCRR